MGTKRAFINVNGNVQTLSESAWLKIDLSKVYFLKPVLYMRCCFFFFFLVFQCYKGLDARRGCIEGKNIN